MSHSAAAPPLPSSFNVNAILLSSYNLSNSQSSLLRILFFEPSHQTISIMAYYAKQRAQRLANPSFYQPHLISWKLEKDLFEEVVPRDEPLRVEIRVIWSRVGALEGSWNWYPDWEAEEELHQHYKDLLLKFWEDRGGRDVQIHEKFKDSGQLYKDRPFLIHRVLRTRKVRGKRQKRQYLVEWVGYAEPTWQDGKTLPKSLIRDFYRHKRSTGRTI
jgi:hypothetical protein